MNNMHVTHLSNAFLGGFALGGGWGGESGGGDEGGGEDVIEDCGGGGGELEGLVEDGEEAEEFFGLGPGGGADLVEGAGLLAFARLHSVAEPGAEDFEAGDFEVPDFGGYGGEGAGAYGEGLGFGVVGELLGHALHGGDLLGRGGHSRAGLVPLAGGQLPAPEELVQGLGVDVERGELGGVAGDGPQHVLGDLFGLVPVDVEPVLELGSLPAALDLDVQLDVLGEPGPGEVAGPDQRLGTDHVELGVGDVGLGVELVAPIHPTLDLALLQGLDHRLHAFQEGVIVLLGFQTVIQPPNPVLESLGKCVARA